MAKRKHTKPDSIWLFDYNSLLAMDDCPKWFVLLSERDMNIIWQATLNIDRFRSRVFTDVDGPYYTIADLDQFGNFKEWVSDMNVNMGDFMACNELLERMTLALEALVEKDCCPAGTQGGYTGSRGGGTQARPPIDYDETEGTEVPPPGFDTWAEYRSHKCNASADLIRNLISDLQGLSGLSYAATSPSTLVQTLVVFFLTPVPYDDLITLAAYLIGTGYNYSFLSTMSTEINDNYENLLCLLYNSASPESAKTDFLAELETIALAAFTSSDDAQWTMGAVEYMLSYDSFNKLFENNPTTIQDADCSNCGGEFLVEIFDILEVGDTGILTQEGNHYTLEAVFNSGRYAAAVHVVDPQNTSIPLCAILTNVTRTGGNPQAEYPDYGYLCGSSEVETIPNPYKIEAWEDLCVHAFGLQSVDPFTIEFDMIDACEP